MVLGLDDELIDIVVHDEAIPNVDDLLAGPQEAKTFVGPNRREIVPVYRELYSTAPTVNGKTPNELDAGARVPVPARRIPDIDLAEKQYLVPDLEPKVADRNVLDFDEKVSDALSGDLARNGVGRLERTEHVLDLLSADDRLVVLCPDFPCEASDAIDVGWRLDFANGRGCLLLGHPPGS